MVLRLVPSTPISHDPPPPQPSPQILPVPNSVPSYWLSQPSEHANLRSTPELPSECDVAIIGSGMAGILTAYWILRNASKENEKGRGDGGIPSVVLLEARDLCSGATARNGGHAKVKTATLAGLKSGSGEGGRNELAVFVDSVIRELAGVIGDEAGLGAECEFELRRSFDVFQDEAELAPIKAAYDEAQKRGETWARERSYVAGEMAENVTGIKGAIGAFSVPCASFWPYKFVTGLLSRLVARFPGNLNVQTHTAVTGLHEQSDGTGSILTTPRGTLRASKVVLATNAWTAGILPHFKDTITPVKGMACHIRTPHPVHPHLNNTYNIHFSPAQSTGVDYLNPRPDGSIVVGGGGWHFRDDKALWHRNFDDATPFPPPIENHWRTAYMQRTFLGWSDSNAAPDSIWVGIMGSTTDGRCWVGRVPGAKTQWMLAGFNGGGMAQIPVFARAVARMVVADLGFGDVRGEFGLLGGCGTERMGG